MQGTDNTEQKPHPLYNQACALQGGAAAGDTSYFI